MPRNDGRYLDWLHDLMVHHHVRLRLGDGNPRASSTEPAFFFAIVTTSSLAMFA